MSETTRIDPSALSESQLFAGLSGDAINQLVAACEERRLLAGEVLFQEHDLGDALWIVQRGRAEVFKVVGPETDRVLTSVGAGDVLGELAFCEQPRRTAGARTTEASSFLVLTRDAFEALERSRPEIAARFYRNLAVILAARLRTTNDLYREAVAFGLEAAGVGALKLGNLTEQLREVTVLLMGGSQRRGRIVQFESTAAGHTLVLRESGGRTVMLPYHAVLGVEL